ncbi:MAG: cold shock domain-containing protein [Lentimicrobiaceae bacterium]
MIKSQTTRIKQEKEKQKQKKKKDKAAKKIERLAGARDGSNLDDMIAYVDEYGQITSTPPDPLQKGIIKVEDIDIEVRNKNVSRNEDTPRTGVVSFFNDSKGYGFIKDSVSQESLFVHINSLDGPIKEGDIVTFMTERSPKGMNATNVKKIK